MFPLPLDFARRFVPMLQLLAVAVLLAAPSSRAWGQAGRVDPSFDTVSLGLRQTGVAAVAIQRDGKILVAGGQRGIARLNADGSVDTGFTPNVTVGLESIDGSRYPEYLRVYCLAVQADGKILLGGNFIKVNGQTRNRLARLNPDGSLDASFAADVPNTGSTQFSRVTGLVVQPDGKILLSGDFGQVNGVERGNFARLNPNGSLDASFPVFDEAVNSVVVQADGKILLAGGTGISRLNRDGSPDPSFNPDNAQISGVSSVALQSDGKIVLAGGYLVDGQTRGVVRLNVNGGLDAGFAPVFTDGVYTVAVQTDGKIVFADYVTDANNQTSIKVARLNANGSLDQGFAPADTGGPESGSVSAVVVQADGKVLLGGYFTQVNGAERNSLCRLSANGALDDAFVADVVSGPNGRVSGTALQPDGKVIVSGEFSRVSGVARSGVARFNADGSLDSGFAPSLNGTVRDVAVQTDGKILLGGSFTLLNGQARSRIARLNADGSLDASFTAVVGGREGAAVAGIALQTDRKIILTGSFSQVNGAPRNSLARLNPDGSVDPVFVASVEDGGGGVSIQADGKIILGGGKSLRVNGTTSSYVARLNPDGSLDTSFVPNLNLPSVSGALLAFSVASQRDGKIVVGVSGYSASGTRTFTYLGYVVRLKVNGSPDAGFTPAGTNGVQVSRNVSLGGLSFRVASQPDGKILLGGFFGRINGEARNGVARLNTDGSLDTGFAPKLEAVVGSVEADTFTIVSSLTLQTDGKVLLGGDFTQINGVTRNYLGRLNADGSLDPTFNPAGVPSIAAVLRQPDDGRVLVGGSFFSLASRLTPGLARLNPDGSLDATFVAPLPTGSSVQALALDPLAGNDADLLVAALSPTGSGTGAARGPEAAHPRRSGPHAQSKLTNKITRLKRNGSADPGFNADANTDGVTLAVSAQSLNGQRRVLVGGAFALVNGQPRANLGRLLADGTLDANFRADADGAVRALKVQPADGRIVVAGEFTAIAGQNRARLARLNFDGSLDGGFNPGAGADGPVDSLALQPADGKIVLGGRFSRVNGQPRAGVARLNADGSLDADFNPGPIAPPAARGHGPGAPAPRAVGDLAPGVATVNAIDVFSDGKIGVGGEFGAIGATARRRVARLNANGSVDPAFDPGAGPDAAVRALQFQPDGRTLLGGDFAVVDTSQRTAVARLLGDGNNGGPSDSRPVVVSVVGAPARGGFVVSRTGSAGAAVSIVYHNGGSAGRGVDYEAFSGRLNLEAGQREAVIAIRLLPGANRGKKVKVFLDAAEGYGIGKAQSKVLLSDLP